MAARSAVGATWKFRLADSRSARIGASTNGGSVPTPATFAKKSFSGTVASALSAGADTRAAYGELRRARGIKREKLLARWGLKRLSRKTLWDADHILPVAEGGGECDLENLRTLCLLCHRQQTLELRRRLLANSATAES